MEEREKDAEIKIGRDAEREEKREEERRNRKIGILGYRDIGI